MALYAVIDNRAIELMGYKSEYNQDEIPTFDVTLPMRYVYDLQIYLQDIAVYRDGELLNAGIIRTPSLFPILKDSISTPITNTLKCDGYLGKIFNEASIEVHFQHTLLSVAIATLLAATTESTWVLNDTTTLEDVEITADLRSKQTLWVQIQEALKASGNVTFIRYGGKTDAGVYLADIGYFNRRFSNQRAVWHDNIISTPRFKEPTMEPIKSYYPISGDSASVPIDLDDALNIDPTLSDPSQDYQIIPGTGRVENNTIDVGIKVRKQISIHKTKNDAPPTQPQMNQTALSLYRRSVREMRLAGRGYVSMSVKIASDVAPIMHEAIWFSGTVFEEDYDLYTEKYSMIPVMEMSRWLRVVGIKADYRERLVETDPLTEKPLPLGVFELDLSSTDVRDNYDSSSIVHDTLDKNDTFDNQSAVVMGDIGIRGIRYVSLHRVGVVANCAYDGPGTGRKFEFTTPAAPTGSTDVIVQVKSVDPIDYPYHVTQNGDLSQNLILCVAGLNGDPWTIADDVTITVSYIFT
jgi:hypothetical protein